MDALCALSVYVPSPKHFGNPDYDHGPTLPSLESQPKNTNALGSSKGSVLCTTPNLETTDASKFRDALFGEGAGEIRARGYVG